MVALTKPQHLIELPALEPQGKSNEWGERLKKPSTFGRIVRAIDTPRTKPTSLTLWEVNNG